MAKPSKGTPRDKRLKANKTSRRATSTTSSSGSSRKVPFKGAAKPFGRKR